MASGDVTWPTVDELKQRLDVTSTDWDDQLGRVIAAAIDITKHRIGNWDEMLDEPDEALAQSALELGVEMAQTGDAAISAIRSKSYSLLYGKRRRFGLS